jgi:hypothetical protein
MDQFGYAQAAQAMLPTPGQPGAQQMPFQKASTQMCRQAIEVLRQLANQYKTEGQMAEEGQITAMVARLIKLCERKSKEESQVAEALLGGM